MISGDMDSQNMVSASITVWPTDLTVKGGSQEVCPQLPLKDHA